MADELVKIKLKVEARDAELTKVIAKLKTLEQMERRLASGRRMENYARNQSRSLNEMTRGWKRHFDSVDAGIKMMGKGLSGFLKLSIKGVILEMGLLGASMVAVHATFVAGQLIMKAYRGVMQVVAGGAAGLTVALSAVAAAIREQQSAIYAYRGKGAKEFGSAMNQTRMGMRALHADANLATLGVDALNKAYGVMSKTMNVRQIAGSKGAIKALMDFGSAGQDPAKGLEQVAAVIQALNDPKKGLSAVKSEAKKLGPEMTKALKGANIKTKKDFENLLFSGELAKKGGVTGQFDAVNSTLITQLKGYMTQAKTMFADYGDQFLEPLKVAFSDIFQILKRDMARIMGAVQLTVGTDGYIDGFVGMIDKTSTWMVKMIREYLPNAVGMFDRIGNWMKDFKRGWNDVLDYLRPLVDGARVLYKALNPIWEAIKGGAQNLFLMRSLLIDNSDNVEEFGERIGGLITALSDLMMNMKVMFFEILPFLNDVISGITDIFKMMSKLLTGMAGGGFAKALAPLLAFSVIGRGMQGVKGRLMPGAVPFRQNMMNVQANVVNVNGGPAGPVGSAPLSSGATGQSSLRQVNGAAPVMASGAVYGPALPIGSMPLGELKNQPGMKLGALVRGGMDSAVRNSNAGLKIAGYTRNINANPGLGAYAISRAAGAIGGYTPSGPRFGGLTLKRAAINSVKNFGQRRQREYVTTEYGLRRGFGAFRGAMGYAGSGAWDEKSGSYVDIAATRSALRAKRDADLQNQTAAGAMTRAKIKIREKIDQNRISRNYTKFGAATGRFNNSMTGRMGTSMGLGLLSQVAPEEMRGAMALGGMVGQFNPLLGLGVAGVGGALKAEGSLKGALSGAAGGAAIGSMFGPWGAVIGGGIGALTGGIMGWVNKGKADLKKAEKAAKESFNSLYSNVASSASIKLQGFQKILESGGTLAPGTKGAFQNQAQIMLARQQTLQNTILGKKPNGVSSFRPPQEVLEDLYRNQSRLGITITEEQMKDQNKNADTASKAVETYLKEISKSEKPLKAIQKQEEARMAMLVKMTGKTVPELEILAKSIGFDLYDPAVEFSKVVEKLGAAVLRTSQDFKFAMQDVFLAGSNPFRKSIEQREGEAAVNQSAASLQAVLTSNASDVEKNMALEQTMADFFPQILAASGGDPIAAYLSTQALFGQGPKGGAFATGATYAGQGEFFAKNTAFQQMLLEQKQSMPKLAAEQLSGYVFSQTGKALDMSTLIPAIGQLAPELQNKLLTDLSTLDQNTMLRNGLDMVERNKIKGINPFSSDEGIFSVLGNMGLAGVTLTGPGEDVNSVSDAIAGIKKPMDTLGVELKDLQAQIKTLNDNFGKFFEEGDTRTPRGGGIGDTSTSRLGQTMSRHSALDSQLTGKRTITSAFRTWGLGSPSSDHAMGRAYDLTGQNLGQYAKLVHANGGFAEFHGAAANRHLHVVPGPGIGDTSTMKATVASSGGGSVTNYYNFEINGGGQSPEAIAQMVMMKIKDNERAQRERS